MKNLLSNKKIKELQFELAMAKEDEKKTREEYETLKNNILVSYDGLTTYFKYALVGKYFDLHDGDQVLYFQCIDLKYNGGFIYMDIMYPNNEIGNIIFEPDELCILKQIKKKDFYDKLVLFTRN